MDLAVDSRLSGDGSFIYSTPAVKTFPKPSIHVIYPFHVYFILMEDARPNKYQTNEHFKNMKIERKRKRKKEANANVLACN